MIPSEADSLSTQSGVLPQALHALRRRWLLATFAVAVVGGAAGAARWYFAEPSFRALQLIKISMSQLPLVFQQAPAGGQANFETFKKSQRKMVTSFQVLSSALGRQEVGELAAVQEAQRTQVDTVVWLRNKVGVTDDAEYLEVSVADPDAATATTLLKAIIKVYKDNVMAEENREETARLSKLEEIASEYEVSLRAKQEHLKNLNAINGAASGADIEIGDNQRSELAAVRQEIRQREPEWLEKKVRLQLLHEALTKEPADDGADPLVSDSELDLAMEADSQATNDRVQIDRLRAELARLERTLRPDAKYRVERTPEIEKSIAEIEAKLGERRKHLRKLIADQKRSGGTKGPSGDQVLALEIQALEQVLTQLKEKETDLLKKIGSGLSEDAFDTLVARSDIEQRQGILDEIRIKIEETRVESNSAERITLSGDPYTSQLDTPATRLKSAATTGGLAALGGLLPLLWWEIRKKRLVHVQDLPTTTNLELLGSLPLMPRQPWRRRRAALQLAESANSVAALLTHRVNEPRGSVVLVSSPMPGEGKTTLAAHLAASLALAGRRTLLIDCDLRRPSLHRIYDVDLVPGFGDVLITPETLDSAVQPTNLAGLSLLSAGSRAGTAIELLQTDRVAGLFKTLRDQYEFVVVDTSPILPVVDTRIIGRHADGIIFSLLRDVTEVSKVVNACQIMSAFGIPVLGAVMIGAGGELYYDDQGTLAAQSA